MTWPLPVPFTSMDRRTFSSASRAFNWLNHPLPQFTSANQVTLKYLANYDTKAIVLNTVGNGATSPTFGYMDTKTALPYSRTLELNVKYTF